MSFLLMTSARNQMSMIEPSRCRCRLFGEAGISERRDYLLPGVQRIPHLYALSRWDWSPLM